MNTKAGRKNDSGKMEIEMECTARGGSITKLATKVSVLGGESNILLLTMYKNRLKERL